MPIVAKGGAVTLTGIVGHSNGNPADDPDLTLSILAPSGDPLAGFPVAIPPIVRVELGRYTFAWTCPADLATSRDAGGDYTAHWAATVDGDDASGDETILVVEPDEVETTLVSLAEVRALVKTRLSDTDLQAIIDREEEWLATKIGVLSGERTDTFRPGVTNTPLYLSRRTDSVTVTDAGVAVAASDLMFTPSTGCLRRVSGVYPWPYTPPEMWYASWQGDVTVTWTPVDGAEVARVIIELIRGTVSETGFDSETIGDYSYTRGAAAGRVSRAGLVRGLLLRRAAYSLSLRSMTEARP